MKQVVGDIRNCNAGVMINGVNCQRAMGSGVAKAYFTMWPEVRQQYMLWDKSQMKLGKMDVVIIDHGRHYVANCWTQDFYGYDGKQYADYGAVLASVSQAALFARSHNLPVCTPLVGCGLGGLEEHVVVKLLESVESITNVPFILYRYDTKNNC